MLAQGRLLAVVSACSLSMHKAAASACSAADSSFTLTQLASISGAFHIPTSQQRLATSLAADKGPEKQSDTPSPPPSPSTTPQAQALADSLRQSSPTGRLFDLFIPQGRKPSPSSPSFLPSPNFATTSAPASDADIAHVILRAVENCKPLMMVQKHQQGNRIMYVPRPLDPARSTALAVKWLLQAAAKRKADSRGVGMPECLALELLLAYQRKGGARAKRDEMHKLALDNRSNLLKGRGAP